MAIISDNTKLRTHTIQGTVSSVATELQTFTQTLANSTVIHSVTKVRGKNNQGLIMTILYELP